MISLDPFVIISSFSQTQESDFAVGTVPGSAVISQEIEIQREKLISLLHPEVQKLLNEKTIHERVAISRISSTQIKIQPSLSPISNSIQFRLISKREFNNCVQDCTFSSNSSFITLNSPYIYNDSDSNENEVEAEILYEFDVNSFSSLLAFLRDMVCCNLGARIFPAINSDSWSIVRHYCSQLKFIYDQAGVFIPPEIRKIRFVNRNFATIKIIRTARS